MKTSLKLLGVLLISLVLTGCGSNVDHSKYIDVAEATLTEPGQLLLTMYADAKREDLEAGDLILLKDDVELDASKISTVEFIPGSPYEGTYVFTEVLDPGTYVVRRNPYFGDPKTFDITLWHRRADQSDLKFSSDTYESFELDESWKFTPIVEEE